MRLTRIRRAGKPPGRRNGREVPASERERTRSSRFGANLFQIATSYWLPRVRSLTTQAQRPGPRRRGLQPERGGRVRCSACLGVAAEPVRETRRTETWIVAGREALVVHCYAVIGRLGIGDYRPWVPGCVQELPHEVVLTDRFGTGQIERAVQRLSEGHIGHD